MTPTKTQATIATLVSTERWGMLSPVKSAEVFFCVQCWRNYIAGHLTPAEIEVSLYNAVRSGLPEKPRWRCARCMEPVERYLRAGDSPVTPPGIPPEEPAADVESWLAGMGAEELPL